MNFQTHNDKHINVVGTYFQGSIDCDYKKIKSIFGKPHKGDGYKVDAEWNIEFENGEIATIYNYKDEKNYCGKEGLPKTKITDWHVGGYNNSVIKLICKLLQ